LKTKTLLMTGATGIMGSWVLGEALARGYNVLALMRDRDQAQAARRLRAVLHHVDMPGAMNRIEVVSADAGIPGFGLDDIQIRRLRERADMMVHCAACTSFNPDQDETCWSVNYGGVKSVLAFVNGTDIPLYHVSTAYVAGQRRGRVLETELDEGQDFSNTYERSKAASEKLVREAFASGEAHGAIFRPSIITGGSKDGRILQFMNFYNMLRIVDLLATRRARSERSVVRMAMDPAGTKNVIPVDWSVQAMWHIIEAEGPSGQAYHLTNPNPPCHEMFRWWAMTFLADAGIDVAFVPSLEGPLTSLEALYDGRMANYAPYMFGEPVFDRTNTDRALDGAVPFPSMDAAFLNQLLAYAREQKWRSLFDSRSTASKMLEESPYNDISSSEVATAGV
jgi:thioester reductase-like protein